MTNFTRLRALLSLALLTGAAAAQFQFPTGSVTTPPTDGPLFGRSIMFNLSTPSFLPGATVESIELLPTASGEIPNARFDLYFRVGGYAGYETDPNAWLPLCSDTTNTNDPVIDIPNLTLSSGETIGVALIRRHGVFTPRIQGPWTGNDGPFGSLIVSGGAYASTPFGPVLDNLVPAMKVRYDAFTPTHDLAIAEHVNGNPYSSSQPVSYPITSTQTATADAQLLGADFQYWEVNGLPLSANVQAISLPMRADFTLTATYKHIADATVYGSSCGPLDLIVSAGSAAEIGRDCELRIPPGPPINPLALLIVGFEEASVSLGVLGVPSCTLLNTADLTVAAGPSSMLFTFAIPDDDDLLGLELFTQALLLSQFPGLELTFTNGVALTVGHP